MLVVKCSGVAESTLKKPSPAMSTESATKCHMPAADVVSSGTCMMASSKYTNVSESASYRIFTEGSPSCSKAATTTWPEAPGATLTHIDMAYPSSPKRGGMATKMASSPPAHESAVCSNAKGATSSRVGLPTPNAAVSGTSTRGASHTSDVVVMSVGVASMPPASACFVKGPSSKSCSKPGRVPLPSAPVAHVPWSAPTASPVSVTP
mmetsp:Transcript_16685/g.54535  ORF Transcript_16685/g.54535 Transcript_16685/m.54535 type:complete len:207 (+) Transcript_16685:120-740(+)